MNLTRHTDAEFEQRLRQLTAPSSLFDAGIEERARAILAEVRARGDAAVLEFTARFDGAKLDASQLAQGRRRLAAGGQRGGGQHCGFRPQVASEELGDAQFARRPGRGEI